MLVEYIIGRRLRELDVSGRDAAGAFIDAENTADVPHRFIVVDDAKGIQTALLRRLAEVAVHHDRIDESRIAATVESPTVPARFPDRRPRRNPRTGGERAQ
jgi:16S rRNA (guanine1207-N2)-methyltransferase